MMMLVREILCATDVEEPTHAGLPYSFFLADQFQCALHLVHGCPEAEATRHHAYLTGAQRMEHLLARYRLRERLDAAVRAVPEGCSGPPTTEVVDGELTDAVVACSERQRVDLIVVDSPLRQIACPDSGDSVAARLAQQVSCPILTVPAGAPAPIPRLKRILLALEPSPTLGLTVEWTALWARRFGAVVQLLYRDGSGPGASAGDALCRHEIEQKLRREGVGIDAVFAEPGSRMVERIVHRAESGRCDLVVMSTALRDDADRYVLESLRRTAVVPVLSVRDVMPERRFVYNLFEGGFGQALGQPQAQANDRSRWATASRRLSAKTGTSDRHG